ncbi:MAG: Na/Pi cotransporter family protein, partial [Clostridia bacterium]|nr:Na/Pi cotransporter family protein [Clostridia bacterium]
MDLFDILTLVGGLCLFLFGMDIMGQSLERRAGDSLRTLLGKLTTGKIAGLLTGLAVTAVIQSSSATTVMVVGFVNSGLMSLKQAIHVIMGANVGTTVTAWILSLGGISGDNLFVQLLKPTSFTPILALIGIIYTMFSKDSKKKDTGCILLGFAVLMFGMDTMSGAVSGLKDVPQFRELFIMFKNPILGVLAGAVLTAIIQSSSASVGILQALAVTGQVSFGAAIPIIMGQNIGTCITALLSSVGATKNAKRASFVHLAFNVIGTVIWLCVYFVINLVVRPVILDQSANAFGIAVCHTVFNVGCLLVMLPLSGFLEKLAETFIRDAKKPEETAELDERLLATPPLALQQCTRLSFDMAACATLALKDSLKVIQNFDQNLAEEIRKNEQKTDHYEDILGSYLIKLSSYQISERDNAEAAKLLRLIGDFERISDHGKDILKSAEELRTKEWAFTKEAMAELAVMCAAVEEISDMALTAFIRNDLELASKVEPLEQVID